VTVIKHFSIQGDNINLWNNMLIGGYTNEMSGALTAFM